MNTKREQRKLAAIEQQIDENLRRVYQEDTTKEVPDRFMALLQQLREQE
ncbi:NepR family anti-sigma factor [Paracoccus jiaweipingae]